MRNKPLTTVLLAFSLLLSSLVADENANPAAKLLRDALFAEEADRDLAKAEKGYRQIVKNFDTDRIYAATAILRLAEILHQRGDTAEAEKWFARILQEFPDQEAIVKVAATRLGDKAAALRKAGPAKANPQTLEIARLKNLLRQSPDLLNTPKDGTTPLLIAATNGHLEAVEFLLSNGANVNSYGDAPSALAAAVTNGHLAVVERLIKAASKLEPDLVNKSVLSGNYAVTELLLKAGAPANTRALITLNSKSFIDSPSGALPHTYRDRRPEDSYPRPGGVRVRWTPLETAVYLRFSKLTDLLIANGAKSQMTDSTYTEALRFAIIDQNIELVATLLKNGANPNSQWEIIPRSANLSQSASPPRPRFASQKEKQVTPKLSALSLATAWGNVEITKLLIKAGANVNIVEAPDQTTPLHHADLKTTPILLAAGANPKVIDQEGKTLLHSLPDAAKLKLLLAAGADLNAVNNEGLTPLIMAVANLRADLVTALLAAGANPNGIPNNPAPLSFLPDRRGYTVKGGRSNPNFPPPIYGPVIRALVDAGADPNTLGESKMTALMRAASSDDLETVRYLLEKGAILEAGDNFAFAMAPKDSPTKVELFLATYQQPKRRKGTIRVISPEHGQIYAEVAALNLIEGDFPTCPHSLLEAYAFTHPGNNLAFGEVTIWREGEVKPLKFNLRKIIASGDHTQDIELAWGDLIQFSSAKSREERAVNKAEKEFLDSHLNREVIFIYEEQTNKVQLEIEWEKLPNTESWLRKERPQSRFDYSQKPQRLPLMPLQDFTITQSDSMAQALTGKHIERDKIKFELATSENTTLWPEPGDTLYLKKRPIIKRYGQTPLAPRSRTPPVPGSRIPTAPSSRR